MTQTDSDLPNSAPMLARYDPPPAGGGRINDLLRRASHYVTRHIAVRRGDAFGMWIGCGYPKSGTVWLCQLMSSVLDLPYARNFQSPVAMASVVHSHWDYDPRLPNSIYTLRDGRDVMISFYHHRIRTMDGHRSPRQGARVRRLMEHRFGNSFDPADISNNLAGFIEMEFDGKFGHGTPWHRHVEQWTDGVKKNRAGRNHVGVVRYEDLLTDPVDSLGAAFETVLGARFEPWIIETAIKRFDFQRRTGRQPGSEDRTSFLRKGTSGQWPDVFTRDAGEVMERRAGDLLRRLGYATDGWVEDLPRSR